MLKPYNEKARWIIIDQVEQNIKDWARRYKFAPPEKKYLHRLRTDTLLNIEHIFGAKLTVVSEIDVVDLTKLLNPKRAAIFIAPSLFSRVEFYCQEKQIPYGYFTVSRARLPKEDGVFYAGHGLLTGRGEKINKQISLLRRILQMKQCVLFDDSATYGSTLQESAKIFEKNNINLSMFGIGACLLPLETKIENKKIVAEKWISPKDTLGCIELKDFLDINGSGAAYPKGTFRQKGLIYKLFQRLNKAKRGDFSAITELGIKIKNPMLLRKKLHAIIDFESITNTELNLVLKLLEIPEVDFDIVSEGRISYLWPEYHTKHWCLSKKKWREISLKQHELSLKLYERVGKKSRRSVRVKEVPSLCEKSINPHLPITKYLKKIIDSMQKF